MQSLVTAGLSRQNPLSMRTGAASCLWLTITSLSSSLDTEAARRGGDNSTMCLQKTLPNISSSQKSISRAQKSILRVERTITRPRLPRSIASSCRINLNKFWGELEDFYINKTSSKVIKDLHDNVEEMENSINENIERSRLMMENLNNSNGSFVLQFPSPSSSS